MAAQAKFKGLNNNNKIRGANSDVEQKVGSARGNSNISSL